MAKMRISPELKKLIEKYRCVKDTEGMSPAKVYKLVGENENLYLKMTDSRYKGTTYDVERSRTVLHCRHCGRAEGQRQQERQRESSICFLHIRSASFLTAIGPAPN